MGTMSEIFHKTKTLLLFYKNKPWNSQSSKQLSPSSMRIQKTNLILYNSSSERMKWINIDKRYSKFAGSIIYRSRWKIVNHRSLTMDSDSSLLNSNRWQHLSRYVWLKHDWSALSHYLSKIVLYSMILYLMISGIRFYQSNSLIEIIRIQNNITNQPDSYVQLTQQSPTHRKSHCRSRSQRNSKRNQSSYILSRHQSQMEGCE